MTPDDLRYIKSVVAVGLCCEPAILGDLVRAYDTQAARIAELEAYVRECVTNWDHDEDAHTHHTSCRVCQGEAL